MTQEGRRPENADETEKLAAHVEALRREHVKVRRFFLLVYENDRCTALSLEPGDPVILGREVHAGFRIADPSVSKAHAEFTLVDDRVEVRDLRSSNGTWVNGKKIDGGKGTRLASGDTVMLGGAMVLVHSPEVRDAEEYGLLTDDQFRFLVHEEILRSKHFQRSFAMFMIRATGSSPRLAYSFAHELRKLLEPSERLAMFTHTILQVLLPEQDQKRAQRRKRQLQEEAGRAGIPVDVGMAVWPEMGQNLEQLIERCRSTLSIDLPADAPAPPREVARREAEVVVPHSVAMQRIQDDLPQLAASRVPLLIRGETGVGKEVLARAVHDHGPRRRKPFVSLNCGAIPSTLVESTLFGYERGAFNDAKERRAGVFEAADGGTLFLDEIGELPLDTQKALLRVLDKKVFMRVGSPEEVKVDVRVIAATHRDLEAMCARGTFREDLYFRLCVLTATVEPLRRRVEDIRPLVRVFLDEANAENGGPRKNISEDTLEALERFAWPGNVRELRNEIFRAVVMTRSDTITVAHLPERIRMASTPVRTEAGEAPAAAPSFDAAAAPSTPPSDGSPVPPGVTLPAGRSGPPDVVPSARTSLRQRISEYRHQLIQDALDACEGNQTRAARQLGIPLRTLVRWLHAPGKGASKRRR